MLLIKCRFSELVCSMSKVTVISVSTFLTSSKHLTDVCLIELITLKLILCKMRKSWQNHEKIKVLTHIHVIMVNIVVDFKKKTTLCEVIFILICIQDVLVNLYVLGNSVL